MGVTVLLDNFAQCRSNLAPNFPGKSFEQCVASNAVRFHTVLNSHEKPHDQMVRVLPPF